MAITWSKSIVSLKNHNGPSLFTAHVQPYLSSLSRLNRHESWTHVILLLKLGLAFDNKEFGEIQSDLNISLHH
jgi:hypothetical protein